MADRTRKQTDKELAHLERKIYDLYATSQAEISEKWRKYMSFHKKKLDKLYNELQEAKKSGDKDAIRDATEKYERAVKNVTLNDKRYKAMINETTAKIANVNQIALDYVNGDMPKIYTLNYNAFGDEEIDGYTFTLTNEDAVKNLMLNNRLRLPTKQLDRIKDKKWNAKNINSQLMQGILMGESIDKISKRLRNVTNMNQASAIRNARTMVTSAENRGRQDSFKRAEKDGIIMVRKWVATHDERTRVWHADLNGVEVGVDEPWENDYGKIMYPGDPTADPCNVYNCRCSERAHIVGFDWGKKDKDQQDNNGLTLKEQGAIMSYKSSDYYMIDYILRTKGMSALTDNQKEQVLLLDQALKKLPQYSGNLSRSIYFEDPDDFNDFIKKAQESDEQRFKAFTSTTKSNELYNPEGQVQMFIEDATRGRDLEGYDNDEEEVLYERNARFKVKRQYWANGVYIIILKEIIR